MRREVRWERMFVDEIEAAFEACPVAYLPYGLCEPHGPQNALGCDGLRAHAFTRRAAELHGGVVCPPMFWNVHEQGVYAAWGEAVIGQRKPWLTALPPAMFLKNILYHVRTCENWEFKVIVVFSGHSGPHARDVKQLQEVLQPHFAGRLVFVLDGDFPEVWAGSAGHGGAAETAMLWAAHEDCTDLSRLPEPDAPGPHFAMGADAAKASLRRGQEIIQEVGDRLGKLAGEALAEYDRLQPQRRFLSYENVEDIWEQSVAPLVKDFKSMQPLAEGQQPPPEGSIWRRNWAPPGKW
ncbi:MAG: creatininase family protein [Armatimonadota bacterium]